MKTLFIVLATLVAVNCTFSSTEEEGKQWSFFKLKYNKHYATAEEENLRQKIFVQNLKEIREHNEKYDAGLVSFTKGINQFSDMTKQEFVSTLNFNYVKIPIREENLHVPQYNAILPDYVDWREQGAVTPVKNQQSCKCCYAFSATGAMEGQLFRQTGQLRSLSEQNIVDCSGQLGNKGSNGGTPLYSFQYVQQNSGIDTEDSYPYEGVDGECRYNSESSAGTISDIRFIQQGSESDLQDAVANIGPISAGINSESFHQYHGGINDIPDCNATAINHGVLVVGYGTEDGQDYWIVKNSWGESFGENGYIRMARNKNNQCGIALAALYPVV